MSTEVQTANAGAAQKPVNTSNISASNFVTQRYKAQMEAAKAQKSPPPPPVEEKPIPEPEAAEPIEQHQEPVQETPPADVQEEAKVLSKDVEIENMSEAELKELASKLGSKAVARFGELTAKRRAAEEQLAQLQAELARREEKPLEAKVENNPYSNISTPDELQEKFTQVNEVIEWGEDLLYKSEDLSADDVVANVNGRDYTKREIREKTREARKARDTYLPAQHKEIKLAQDRTVLRQALVDRSKSELSWMQGDDNDIRKQYEAMMSDERLKGLEKALPDLAPQIPYLLAHAANSLYARKPVDVKPSVKLAPNSPIINQSADSLKPEVRQNKALKDLSERFGKSSSYKDFTKLRALQHTKS
jgi:flagellar biosynthesis chaperone FliJ